MASYLPAGSALAAVIQNFSASMLSLWARWLGCVDQQQLPLDSLPLNITVKLNN
jgi:hypothetical protein